MATASESSVLILQVATAAPRLGRRDHFTQLMLTRLGSRPRLLPHERAYLFAGAPDATAPMVAAIRGRSAIQFVFSSVLSEPLPGRSDLQAKLLKLAQEHWLDSGPIIARSQARCQS